MVAWAGALAAALALAGCAGTGARSGAAAAPTTAATPLILPMPILNHTADPGAAAALGPGLAAALHAGGLRLMTEKDLRPILRRHRIRSGGKFDRDDAATLAAETGAEMVLFSSLDFYRPGPEPEVGFSARLVRLADQRVLAAASAAATGEDPAGLFGRGRVERPEELAELVARQLVEELAPPDAARAAAARDRDGRPCRLVALVPLDNTSGGAGADEVTTNILLSRLLAAGYLVIEPGVVRARCLESGAAPRGRIDLPTLRALHESLGPCLAITGTVEAWQPAQGDFREAVPALTLSLRVLDAASGRLLLTWDTETDGADGETILRLGRRHALGDLTQRSLDGFLERLDELEPEKDPS